MKIAEVEFTRNGAGVITWTRDENNQLQKKHHNFKHYWYVEDDKGAYTTLMGQTVRKRYVDKFWEAKSVQKNDEKTTFEGDLGYIKRFIIDKFDTLESKGKPRTCFFDIETTGFTPEDNSIVSIVAYDTYSEEYTDFLADDSEEEMLKRFIEYIRDTDPDILTGWNSDRFDMPFIIERMKILKIPNKLLSRTGREIRDYTTNVGREIRIPGRINIDYLKAYKKMKYGEMDSYALDYVAKEELGYGKIDIEELPGTLFEAGRYDELLCYNRRDVEVMAELDKKLAIVEFLDSVSHLASADFHDTLYNSRIVDSYILRYTSRRGIILPTRKYTNKRSGYTGAKVLDPKKGIHENVGIFDLASLYPSIIISFDLSPETMQREHNEGAKKGLVPILLEDLFLLRQEYRNQGRDVQQRVIKEIMNSFYGVMALPTFRLYTPEMAAAITRHGREIIEHTKSVVENEGYTVIYGDTDSVFVSGIPDTDTAVELESAINKRYDEYASSHELDEHRLRIEFEAFSPVTLMVKKKRYAMRLDDGTYKIAGFQLKRSDTQLLARDAQNTLLTFVLDGAKHYEIRNWYYKTKRRALSGDYDQKMGIPTKYVKDLDEYADGYRIRAAKYSNKHLNKNFSAGDKAVVYLLLQCSTDVEPTDAIALEYDEDIPGGYLLDRRKLWERCDKALKPLLDDLDILETHKQATLF